MADEQTVPAQRGDAGSEEAPPVDSSSEASANGRKPLSGRSAGWWTVQVVLVVVVLAVGWFAYTVHITGSSCLRVW